MNAARRAVAELGGMMGDGTASFGPSCETQARVASSVAGVASVSQRGPSHFLEAHGSPGAKLLQTITGVLPDVLAAPFNKTAGMDRLSALYSAIDIVRRGGTVSLIGVYGGAADPTPWVTMFDKQIQFRMGQANVLRWVDDILPLLTDEDPLGVDNFATHHLSLEDAPHGYEIFQKKEDGAVKIVLRP